VFLNAFDDDNDSVRYEIINGNQENYFAIDQISGTISTAQFLSSITAGTLLNLLIRAKDSGFPARSTELAVTIEITSENNNR